MKKEKTMTHEEAMKVIQTLAGDGSSIIGVRGKEYGSPTHNLALFGELNRVIVKGCIAREERGEKPLDPGVEGSICALMLKVSRVVAAPKIKRDTLLDMVGYTFTLAYSWLTAKKS